MNRNTENAMERAFKNIVACVPEKTEDGHFDEAAQLIKVKREYKEAVDAYEKWLVDGDRKSETEYLEEIADTDFLSPSENLRRNTSRKSPTQ